MKDKITKFSMWAQNHWLALVIIMIIIMLCFLSLVLLSWLIGYYANALYGYKFELNSCLQGIGACGAGMASVAALAKAAWTKYDADSRYNSRQGERPTSQNYYMGGMQNESKGH